MPNALSALQTRVLEVLATLTPPWTLSGGGALAGFHLGHRATRDLDLFWHGREKLGPWREEVRRRLSDAGFEVTPMQGTDTFQRLRATDGGEVVLIDLVAEPLAPLEPPQEVELGSAMIRIDTAHEILVNKLCALLSRSEMRDLVDTQALLDAGGDMMRAIEDAPRKDAGFSVLTLAWVLKDLPLRAMTATEGWDKARAASLSDFRDRLVGELTRIGRPDDAG